MNILRDVEPKNVLNYFEQICSLPHGSGNTRLISNYCVGFAKSEKLEYIRDDMGNVIIFKPGTKGYETSAPVILQGHIDMVCEKDDDAAIDMATEGLRLKLEGDTLTADKTTLGADDGIAVAFMLAVLASDTIVHPPIEAVFTVDEEVGMLGASFIDVSMLKGRTMLNIDTEEEGVFQVSCAGGVTADCRIPYKMHNSYGYDVIITLEGLTGGHSGIEIHKGRADSNRLMGRLLYELKSQYGFNIIDINGGLKDNAIPVKTSAHLLFDEDTALTELEETVNKTVEKFGSEYSLTDPGLNVVVEYIFSPVVTDAMNGEDTNKMITALYCLPGGVQRMSPRINDLVQTSLNMGILKTCEEYVSFSFCVRSSVESEKRELLKRMECLIKTLGGYMMLSGDYPAWEYCEESKLRKIMEKVYEQQYDGKPQVCAVHAGVECGIFADKLPGLDCVSFGPNLYNIHTTRESMDIASVRRTWEFFKEVLKRLI